jgi:serine/threonine protein kinase
MNNYIIIENISSGEYGRVDKVKNKFTNNLLAVKVEDIQTGLLEYEAKIYNCLTGLSCIPSIKSYKKDSKNNYLFMDLMDYDLKTFKKNNFLQDDSKYHNNCKQIIRILINALKDIHSRDIIHRDIKPENICFKNNTIKIIDFGLSKFVKGENKGNKIKNIIGTPNYVSLNIMNLNEPTYIDELETLCYIYLYLILDDNLLKKYQSQDNFQKKNFNIISRYIYLTESKEIINKHLKICRESENIDDIYIELENLYI